MTDHERKMREIANRAFYGTTASVSCPGTINDVVTALLPYLATPEMKACADAWAKYVTANNLLPSTGITPLWVAAVKAAHAYIASREQRGPWQQSGELATHLDGRSASFYDENGKGDAAACAAFVREQNAKERK